MEDITEEQQRVIDKMRSHYSHVHPVLFQRMLEKAKSEFELFDIVDTIPKGSFPLVWDLTSRHLVHATDILGKK